MHPIAAAQPADLTALAPEFTTYRDIGGERDIRLDMLDLATLSA